MKRITMCMAVIAMLLLSCNNGSDKKAMDIDKVSAKDLSFSEETKAVADSGRAAPYQHEKKLTDKIARNEDWDKKIIKIADVRLELKDYAAYHEAIHKNLKAYGAYIAAEEQNLADGYTTNQLTIKVPVDQFENLMNSFSGEGVKVLQKKISSEDVSSEVVDTRARMEAKKQSRDRYLALLKQAKNMKEILEVQQEINSIQQEIESGNGRVNYLNHQSAYSTVHLYYFQSPGTDTPKDPYSYSTKLREGFYVGIRIIANLFIFMVTLWPLLLCGIIAFIVWKRRKIKMTKE